MKIRLEAVNDQTKILEEIFNFEKENKDFFESVLPPRSKEYDQFETFELLMKTLIEEQNRNEFMMFLIRNEKDELVGRINLTMEHDQAELGYRIGYNHQGLGYASLAVKEIISVMESNNMIKTLIAGTSKCNHASRKVLEKNGFSFVNEKLQTIVINGVKIDEINYKYDIKHLISVL